MDPKWPEHNPECLRVVKSGPKVVERGWGIIACPVIQGIGRPDFEDVLRTRSGPELLRVAQSGPEWPRVAKNGQEWTKEHQNGLEWIRVDQRGPKVA